MSLSPGTRLGPYEITAPIGAGGMGEVYKATDTRLDRSVAIKVLPVGVASDPDRRRRFEQEAKAIAALNHPHICVLFDIGSHQGTDYLVMEHLEGETLASRLRRGPLPLSDVLVYGAQMAAALGAAHRRGIVHRDLKPANAMLTASGVKLLDFGLAMLKPAADVLASQSALTTAAPLETSGAMVGTVPYMAPEQLEGKGVDARTDVFALGCVLYEMVTGRRAFEGDSAASVISAILTRDPASLSSVQPVTPPLLDRLVRTCLAKDPERRWQNAQDVAEQLRTLAEASDSGRTSVTPATAPTRRWPRRRVWLAGAVVLAAAATVVAALVLRRSTPPAPTAGNTPSVLALPCKVYGAPDVAYLTDAVPGTMSTLLARVEGLDTKVPPTSLEVEKVSGDRARLADLYQVSSFIETAITASPKTLVLNVQLVDAATRLVRWGHQYEGPRDAYNELVHQAADGIREAVTQGTSPVPMLSQAEEAYREGVFFLNRSTGATGRFSTDSDAALAAFQRALAIDPSFAGAAGKIAELYAGRFGMEGDVHQTLREAESWARRALGIDPRCGEAWTALSFVEGYKNPADPAKGIEYAAKGVAFAPRNPQAHVGMGMWVASDSLAAAALLRAFEFDPLLVTHAGDAAECLCKLGKLREALAIVDRALRLESSAPWPITARGFVLLRLGRLDEAQRSLQSSQAAMAASHTGAALWRDIRLALAVAQGDTATSETLAREVVTSALDDRADALLVLNAGIHAAGPLIRMARTDDAIRILRRGVEAGAVPAYDWLLRDPDIQRLRGDARFAKVLAASRDRATMVANILGQARARGELPAYLHQPLDDLLQLLKDNEARR